jgi:hypothetical protein
MHRAAAMALRGIRRKLDDTRAVRAKEPLRVRHLLRLRACLRLREPNDAALWAMLLCGWWGLLRLDNLCARSRNLAGNFVALGDTRRAGGGFELVIRRSKTNQFGDRQQRVQLLPVDGALSQAQLLCPVRALLSHWRINRLQSAVATDAEAPAVLHAQRQNDMTANH